MAEIKLGDAPNATANGSRAVLILQINGLADGNRFHFRTREFDPAFLEAEDHGEARRTHWWPSLTRRG